MNNWHSGNPFSPEGRIREIVCGYSSVCSKPWFDVANWGVSPPLHSCLEYITKRKIQKQLCTSLECVPSDFYWGVQWLTYDWWFLEVLMRRLCGSPTVNFRLSSAFISSILPTTILVATQSKLQRDMPHSSKFWISPAATGFFYYTGWLTVKGIDFIANICVVRMCMQSFPVGFSWLRFGIWKDRRWLEI